MGANTREEIVFGKIALMLRGMAMGIAEVIPGVSGGTIAFITGIYEKLLATITRFDLSLLSTFKESGIAGLWDRINGRFLLFLFGGMFLGVVAGIVGVSYLLEHYPEPLWGFFFGLILASALYFMRQSIGEGDIKNILLFLFGCVLAYMIVSISPVRGSENLLYVFFSGALAICALILPGISGSFILLLLGMYTVIIPGIKSLATDFSSSTAIMIVVFALGCLTGILLFSRILSYTFKNYEKPTIALMAGFMLGSLKKIWPWRNPTEVMHKETGNAVDINSFLSDPKNEMYKLVQEATVLPADYIGEVRMLPVILCFVLGFALIFLMLRFRDS